MKLSEIKDAVDAGHDIRVGSDGYKVVKDCIGQYLIRCVFNEYCIGLTWRDGKTLNAKEDDFYRFSP